MTILDRVLGRSAPQNANPLENPQYPLTSLSLLDALHITNNTEATVYVNEHSALGMAAVWRAVNLIASGCASLPFHPYKAVAQPGQPQPVPQLVTSGQAAELMANPHPDLTPFELYEIAYAHMLLWGNAYLQKLRDQTGAVKELWPIHPSRILPGRATDGTKVYQLDGEDGYGDDKILHIPGFGYDGVAGLSPIALARQGIGLALAAEKFGAKLFGSGSLAGGILTTEQRLKQADADNLKMRWKAKVGGLDNAHEVAILDAGAKFQQLTIPPEDAQFIESRGFQIEEVARIYGVPPHMLMAVDKTTSWGAGVEQQTLAFVTYTLRPWLTRFEQRMTKLLQPGTVYAKYALEGLLRGDSAARAAFYTQMWNVGALSTNEIRALEEMPPVEGGDVRYRPLNMGELGSTDTATPSTGKEPANAA